MKIAAVLLCCCVLCGCVANPDPVDQAMDLRSALLECEKCSFSCVISADYGDQIYSFQMKCESDSQGNLSFTVTDPETIEGISGRISEEGGSLCFDDKVLAFPLLANERLSPVSTPWIFMNTLTSGYIHGCSQEKDVLRIFLDDSFDDALLRVEVLTDNRNVPVYTAIFWNQKQILSADIRDFTIV